MIPIIRLIRLGATALCLLLPALGPSVAEDELPFTMPVPQGWRTETLPFPLEFAPELPYRGLEELRFAPGMFEKDSPEFWSYAFLWWVELDAPSDPESLSTHLESYFRGLAASVAESREFEVGDAAFAVSIEAGEAGGFRGVAETFDAFVTRAPVRLNIRGSISKCPAQERLVIFFELSPQEEGHSIWSRLDGIRTGFRCNPLRVETPPDG